MPTVTELLTEIRDALDEDVPAQWTDEMLARWINEASRDLARSTRWIKDTDDIALTADVADYALDDNIISVEHVYYVTSGGQRIPLEARHWESMDELWGTWQTQASAQPAFYTILGQPPSALLKLWPVPSVADDLALIVSRLPVPIATDPVVGAATAEVPTLWYDALVSYVEAKALRRDRDPRWTEARQEYVEKRDGLINNPDLLTVARELVPTARGYLPTWIIDGDVDW